MLLATEQLNKSEKGQPSAQTSGLAFSLLAEESTDELPYGQRKQPPGTGNSASLAP
jgi:hypothetical protein